LLDLAAILVLAQTCAPQSAPETLAAVAWAESRFDPLAIGVNRGPRPARRARNAAEAARIARDLLEQGANLDLGVAQINSDNLEWLGLSPEAAFDPCRNLAASDRVLRAGYRPTAGETPQQSLRVALSRYNTGHPERGFRNGYVARVEAAAATLGLAREGEFPASARKAVRPGMKVDLAVAPSRQAPGQIRPSRGRAGAAPAGDPCAPLAFTIQGWRPRTPRTSDKGDGRGRQEARLDSPCSLPSPGPSGRLEEGERAEPRPPASRAGRPLPTFSRASSVPGRNRRRPANDLRTDGVSRRVAGDVPPFPRTSGP
jgi:type IV secretion system protein VirB1